MAKKPNWAKGEFIPKNPEKYIGAGKIIYRSSWELAFMNKCDMHPNIQQWASESIKIPYYNPFKRKASIYVPDFLVHYVDRKGNSIVEILEVKPAKQSIKELATDRHSQAAYALNKVKWAAALKFAKQNGMRFRVMKDTDMFAQKSTKRKTK